MLFLTPNTSRSTWLVLILMTEYVAVMVGPVTKQPRREKGSIEILGGTSERGPVILLHTLKAQRPVDNRISFRPY